MSQAIVIWVISVAAIAGVIFRPFRVPEAIWAVAGALLLASAVVSGGATTITLPDHTGITFGNLTQLNASDLFAG